ncbi:hypothetical protein, partial [Streptomyces sp. t39]|uniref:hypothetical protein n=1 Tax=Streptomyces sp. t39 TaxID=1828156 RepID=UPI0011CE7108
MSGAPASGVIHVRTRLTADFTVIANSLLQRPGSAVTVGVAGYILSLPDGAVVSIDALCEHFTEGEILISRALRELETDGYLARRVERGARGRVVTRTFFHDVPPADRPGRRPVRRTGRASSRRRGAGPGTGTPPARLPDEPAAQAPEPGAPAAEGGQDEAHGTGAAAAPAPPEEAPGGTGPEPAPDPRAEVILASLRLVDRRLILSRREAADLAPAVCRWLARGVEPEDLTTHLTDRLPARLRPHHPPHGPPARPPA